MNLPITLPQSLEAALQRRSWHQIAIGESRAQVFRLRQHGESDLILKTASRESVPSLAHEADRLCWLRNHAPAPVVVDFVQDADSDFLLMAALPGNDAASTMLPQARVVDLLADALRQLHSVPISECPFRASIDDCIADARCCLARGLVDESNFDHANLGRDPRELFQEMLATRPAAETRVFTHGDYCLPNVIINGEAVSGFVDVGRAGIGDPYRDFALIDRTLQRNLGDDWSRRFFARYGLGEPDPNRLRYFRLLDEFF